LKNTIFYFSLVIILSGCIALQLEQKPHIHGRHMTYYVDSLNNYSRLVYTHKPCDSIKVRDTSGRPMKLRNEGIYNNCYHCSELESENNMAVVDNVKFHNKNFSFAVFFPEANLSVHNEICAKYVDDFLDKWPSTSLKKQISSHIINHKEWIQ